MKILLIEDQKLLATTLIKALGEYDDIEIVAHSDKAKEAPNLCRTLEPDIVLMDVYTKDGNGIEITGLLKKEFPYIKVILMTGIDRDHLVGDAKHAGADVFVWKDIPLPDLIEFIRTSEKSYKIFPQASFEASGNKALSTGDIKIIELMARGLTTQEIAEELFLSYGTVRLYISKMYQATGLKSRAQLVSYALQKGLICPD